VYATNVYRETALFDAVQFKRADFVETLIAHGTIPSDRNDSRATVLHVACKYDCPEVFERLCFIVPYIMDDLKMQLTQQVVQLFTKLLRKITLSVSLCYSPTDLIWGTQHCTCVMVRAPSSK